MNLVIDVGNTSTKLAIYDNYKKMSVSRIENLTGDKILDEISAHIIERAIISSVIDIPAPIIDSLASSIPYIHQLSYRSKLPFRLDYETPETLGADRIAGIAGAFRLYPGSDLLVIDAGTAITYDFLSAGVYRGGNISPGLHMRLRALNAFTGKLPLVELSSDFTLPGRKTSDAILAGVITGVTYEINEYIRTFEMQSTDFKIIITGGNSGFLKDKIDHQFIYMPDIVIDGLNHILEYNAA